MSADYALLAEAFDAIAPTYDQQYSASANEIMAWMRHETQQIMCETFPRGGHLLEIGCGAGEDAIALAAHGFTILATDVSNEMTTITEDKVTSAGLTDQIAVCTTPAGHLKKNLGQITFDGAYSNFGALNCEPDLASVASALHDHLPSGAAFVCTMMAPICPVEIVWFAAHFQPRMATRRWKQGWKNVRVIGGAGTSRTVPTQYLSYRELRRVFMLEFSVNYVMSLPLLFPPPYLDAMFHRYQPLWARLEPVERLLRGRWPFNRMGDHLLLVMRRR